MPICLCLPRPRTCVNIRAPDTESDKSRGDNELKVELMTLESLSVPCCTQRAAGTHRASPPKEGNFMGLMEVYHEAVAKWIIARATSRKCEGSEFVFDLIESAIRKEATEILLTPVQASDMHRQDFGRQHHYFRQPKITRSQLGSFSI